MATSVAEQENVMVAASKPFHEAIVQQLNSPYYVNQSGGRDINTMMTDMAVLSALATLVQSSVIPANHDAIWAAFEKKFAGLGLNCSCDELLDHIAAEKARRSPQTSKS
ncbi:MAG: hypothetical protein HY432_03490 [Candidatus Liptonbacteria bacterium]|nr:hypothetical protein [Candidatus Liptonbacteria bacterium]